MSTLSLPLLSLACDATLAEIEADEENAYSVWLQHKNKYRHKKDQSKFVSFEQTRVKEKEIDKLTDNYINRN